MRLDSTAQRNLIIVNQQLVSETAARGAYADICCFIEGCRQSTCRKVDGVGREAVVVGFARDCTDCNTRSTCYTCPVKRAANAVTGKGAYGVATQAGDVEGQTATRDR